MRTWRWMAVALVGLVTASAMAATLDEDEARLEARLRAQRAAEAAKANSVPVLAAAIAPPPSPNDEWLAPPSMPATLAYDELARHVGERLTVVTRGERVHRGTLTAAGARSLTLVVQRRGGAASYTLRREQVVRIEPLQAR